MVRFGFLFATGTGVGFVRTQRTPPPYGPDNVVVVEPTKHVQLPINSESTGLVVLQWFNRVVLTIAQLELLGRPGRAGTPFYREAECRLWLNRKDFHPTPDTAICS